MKILNDAYVLDYLDSETGGSHSFSTENMQIQIDYSCTCKITQDKRGISLFPCTKHKNWANEERLKGVNIHKNTH